MVLINTQKLSQSCLRAAKFILKRDILLALVIAVLVIGVGVGLGHLNNQVVPISTNATSHYNLAPSNPLRFLANWDGANYLHIAQDGYSNSSLTNFFPLYPLVVHSVNTVIGSELDSALLVSWICFVGAIYFLLKVIKRLFNITDNLSALKGVMLFVLAPTAVFMLAAYTESMFALLALGAIYFALTKRYLPAALLTLLATATHINGVFILALVVGILIEEHEKVLKVVASAIIGSLGLGGYMIYQQVRFHNALAFITAQEKHGWLQTGYISHLLSTVDAFNIVALILLAVSVFYWWNRRKSFSLYSFFYICIPLLGGQFGGFNRYVLMVFPVEFMLYERFRDSKIIYPAIIATTSIFWCYFLLQYAGGYIGG